MGWRMLALAGVALGLSGCLTLHQEIVLDDDGGGTFAVQLSVPDAVYRAFLSKPATPALASWARCFDAEAGARAYREAKGIELTAYRVFERDNRHYVDVRGKLTDARAGLASGVLGAWTLTGEADGTQTLAATLPAGASSDTDAADLAAAFAGMKLDLEVRVPGKVIATTAPNRKGSVVTWLFDVDADPGFLKEPPRLEVSWK